METNFLKGLLQLVHYDVHGWEPISLAELKRLNQNLSDQLGEAKKWVADTNAPPNGPGEKKAREAVQTAQVRESLFILPF